MEGEALVILCHKSIGEQHFTFGLLVRHGIYACICMTVELYSLTYTDT